MDASQYQTKIGPVHGWIGFLPYQFALGFTIRYAGEFSPAVRLYLGPIKAGAKYG